MCLSACCHHHIASLQEWGLDEEGAGAGGDQGEGHSQSPGAAKGLRGWGARTGSTVHHGDAVLSEI